MLGRIVGAHLVDDLGIRLERAIAVGEAFRYEDLVPVGSAEHRRDMTTETRGTRADVDGDVEDRPPRNAQELGLGKRRNLEVESTNHPLVCRQRVVVLYEVNVKTVFA